LATWHQLARRRGSQLKVGSPVIALYGGAREFMEQQRIAQVMISISHCRSHATAYAIALGDDKPADEGKPF